MRNHITASALFISVRYALGFLASALLFACAAYPAIGSAPSANPPKIITDPSNSSQRVWDNPSAFGPVPENLLVKGQATCGALNTKEVQYKAIGYHPKAQNFQGQTLVEGGYYCVPK